MEPFRIAITQAVEAQVLCRPLHAAIMLICFTLRPEAYIRILSPTPSRMHIYGMGAETEFS
jgi:hypothetical protein